VASFNERNQQTLARILSCETWAIASDTATTYNIHCTHNDSQPGVQTPGTVITLSPAQVTKQAITIQRQTLHYCCAQVLSPSNLQNALRHMNIFQHVQCCRNNVEIVPVFYFTCDRRRCRWLHV